MNTPAARSDILGVHRHGGRPVWSVLGAGGMIAFLMALWMFLSSKWDAIHLLEGLGSVILVTGLTYWLVFQGVRRPGGRVFFVYSCRWHRLPVFLPWLLWKITVANIQVARMVLSPRMPIDPGVIRIRTGLRGDLARTALGTTITLTPGTCVLDIRGDEFTVHRIHPVTSSDLESGAMVEMVRRTFEVAGDPRSDAVASEAAHA